MIRRREVILGALGATAVAAAAGDSAPGGAAAVSSPPPPAVPVKLGITPATGAKAVSPGEPVVVTVDGGTLRSATVMTGNRTVRGAVQPDGTWRSTEDLAYGTTYRVTASATDSLGATVEKTSAFTTLKPRTTAKITFRANAMNSLEAGNIYGVGQPVIVAFSRPVTDRAAAEKAIDISTSPAVEGKFYWASSQAVHWRPARYWAKGTTIKVGVNALGVDLGNGVYGARNATTHFTIGRQLIAINNTRTHRVKVYIDGTLVRDMACSNGRGGYTTGANGQSIHFWTQAGPHVVLHREKWHSMSSASYGLTDPSNPYFYAPEDVEYCTRITYSGEFLHAAPWNHSLGRANLSHGCVNLGVADARWFFENCLLGDVVEVRHSPKSLPIWDGLGDWAVSFQRYGH
ncbi:Ig-like domain-containing protein [Actinoplanes sp. KI2]|uniref:L,D-transpeptidase n=1 Tax=Actinoplanes sp. KI2 TaxID=2983315 RepID=UPI0021D594EF|nr:Ig-like domain-containing protein [Actinoplanes sp. KI2]MCU7725439.1 Ig-like domain-containing protein [Actinoplanes sp. KI2]